MLQGGGDIGKNQPCAGLAQDDAVEKQLMEAGVCLEGRPCGGVGGRRSIFLRRKSHGGERHVGGELAQGGQQGIAGGKSLGHAEESGEMVKRQVGGELRGGGREDGCGGS